MYMYILSNISHVFIYPSSIRAQYIYLCVCTIYTLFWLDDSTNYIIHPLWVQYELAFFLVWKRCCYFPDVLERVNIAEKWFNICFYRLSHRDYMFYSEPNLFVWQAFYLLKLFSNLTVNLCEYNRLLNH